MGEYTESGQRTSTGHMNIKRQIFEHIVDCETRGLGAPTHDEIRHMFSGLVADVDLHLEQLERERLLSFSRENGHISLVPTFGTVTPIHLSYNGLPEWSGRQSATFNNSIVLDLRGIGIPLDPEMYAMHVLDDSMSDAGIFGGDVALMTSAPMERNDIVGVKVGKRVVLRRFLILGTIAHILAENPRCPDLLPAHDLTFCGVLRGLIRNGIDRNPLRCTPHKKISYSGETPGAQADEPETRNQCAFPPRECDGALLPKKITRSKGCIGSVRQTHTKRIQLRKKRATPRGSMPKPPPELGLNEPPCPVYRTTE